MTNTIASASAIFFDYGFWSWKGWGAVEAVGTIFAFVVGFFSIKKSTDNIKKQLEVEQEPAVVIEDKINNIGSSCRLNIKNVGRGSALRVTVSKSCELSSRDNPFFKNSEPHSRNLFPAEQISWDFDKGLLNTPDANKTNDGECYFTIYCYYESQLGDIYRTEIKLKFLGGDNYVVMENKIEKIQKHG